MSFQDSTEKLVYELCRGSFLSLWSYANPRRWASHRELCDVLVLCEPHIILFSVKNCEFDTQSDPNVALQRWHRRAIEGSVDQLYGAERDLTQATHVIRFDGTHGLPLPSLPERCVHRIAVSLGGKGVVPIPSGDFRSGFVHVFEEEFLHIALTELNTITDFVSYLEAKEHLATENPGIVIEGGEKNLLALYLFNGCEFPKKAPYHSINGANWEVFMGNPAYQRRIVEDKSSYLWDRLLDYLCEMILDGQMEFGNTLSENEEVVRIMARENRFERRILAQSLQEFWELARAHRVRARMLPSPSGVVYVFFNPPPDYDRQARIAELGCRCYIARNEFKDQSIVIGLGLNLERAPQGYATDLFLLSSPEWTQKQEENAKKMKLELNFFQKPELKKGHINEYPTE
jgi:hypothetical protein